MLGITLLTPLITGITGYLVTTGATQKKDNWFFNSQSETELWWGFRFGINGLNFKRQGDEVCECTSLSKGMKKQHHFNNLWKQTEQALSLPFYSCGRLKSEWLGVLLKVTHNRAAPELIWSICNPVFCTLPGWLIIQNWPVVYLTLLLAHFPISSKNSQLIFIIINLCWFLPFYEMLFNNKRLLLFIKYLGIAHVKPHFGLSFHVLLELPLVLKAHPNFWMTLPKSMISNN